MKSQLERLNAEKFKTLSPNLMAKVIGGTTSSGSTATADGKTFEFASDCYELDRNGKWYCEYYNKDGGLIYTWRQK